MLRRLIPLLLMPLFFDGAGAGGGAGTGGTPGNDGTSGQPAGGSGGTGADDGGGTPPAGEKPKDDQPEDTTGLKNALAAARRERDEAVARAREAETKATDLESGSQTEHERALSQAKREGKAEAEGKWAVHVRNARVQGALQAAGIANEKMLGLALNAPELAGLKVDPETGEISGLTEAVEQVKANYPEAFKQAAPPPPPPGGQWDGAAGGGSGKKEPATLEEAVAQELANRK